MEKFEKVSEELQTLNDNSLSEVSKLATQLAEAQEKVEQIQDVLNVWKGVVREISENSLTDAMSELNLTQLTLKNGSKITVTKFYSSSIPKDRADEAFAWLVDNNHGDLIKNQVSVNFVRGEEEKAQEFADELISQDMAVNTRKWVEPMTLKAFCKGQTEKGKHIPPDLFGLYIGDRAKIKL